MFFVTGTFITKCLSLSSLLTAFCFQFLPEIAWLLNLILTLDKLIGILKKILENISHNDLNNDFLKSLWMV